MNKIILRFIVAKSNEVLEVVFDTRLSFMDNFSLLEKPCPISQDNYIVDNNKMIALKKDIPINFFNFHNFMTLFIY